MTLFGRTFAHALVAACLVIVPLAIAQAAGAAIPCSGRGASSPN